MGAARGSRLFLRAATGLTLVFIYFPLVIIFLYAFNGNTSLSWPITNWTTDWFARALADEGVRSALFLSAQVAVMATGVAILLGTLLAFAVQRYSFFGRETISFVVILPIALPGIVTGIALNSAFRATGIPLGTLTIVIGHATFCIVTIYNNAIARLRRTSRSLEEASMDLGADSFQTFRYVTFPAVRTSLVAGALLALGLSFDEVIVTTFTAGLQQTLPIWILSNYLRPNQAPLVNVVAVLVLLVSVVPIYLASRLSSDAGNVGSGTR
jgi:putative spermidine/putrescine transport system permease protein